MLLRARLDQPAAAAVCPYASGPPGITLLAWGNSVGDLVADVVLARRGHAKMAVATCFGSPMLNDVLGLGIALSVGCGAAGDDHTLHVHIDTPLLIACVRRVMSCRRPSVVPPPPSRSVCL